MYKTYQYSCCIFSYQFRENNYYFKMPLIQVDVKMLPMKVHYFLFMGGKCRHFITNNYEDISKKNPFIVLIYLIVEHLPFYNLT